jgi:hypothetical protein
MIASTGSWEKEHKTSKLTKKGVTEQGSVALNLNNRINGVRLAIHGAKWGAGNDLCIGPKLLALSRFLLPSHHFLLSIHQFLLSIHHFLLSIHQFIL